MFGRPGLLYVYLIYGMHCCMNVVTGAPGEGSAVLLRAGEPVEGVEVMRNLRRGARLDHLLAGPGRLCAGLGVERLHDGADLVQADRAFITEGEPATVESVAAGGRVGIRLGVDTAWRFWIRSDPWVSRPS